LKRVRMTGKQLFYTGMGMIGIKFTTQMDQSSVFYYSRVLKL